MHFKKAIEAGLKTVSYLLAAAAVALSIAPAGVDAQSTSKAPGGWTVRRLADGRPDLEGVWENNSATPLERPKQLADKPRLSDAELEMLKRRASTSFGPEEDGKH